jgi:hypothetical protein
MPPLGSRSAAGEARDAWIYQQCMMGLSYKEVFTRLGEMVQARHWYMVKSAQYLGQVARDYARRQGYPLPGRRPRKGK